MLPHAADITDFARFVWRHTVWYKMENIYLMFHLFLLTNGKPKGNKSIVISEMIK